MQFVILDTKKFDLFLIICIQMIYIWCPCTEYHNAKISQYYAVSMSSPTNGVVAGMTYAQDDLHTILCPVEQLRTNVWWHLSYIPGISYGFDSRHVSHSGPSFPACHRKQCMAGYRVDHERGVMCNS